MRIGGRHEIDCCCEICICEKEAQRTSIQKLLVAAKEKLALNPSQQEQPQGSEVKRYRAAGLGLLPQCAHWSLPDVVLATDYDTALATIATLKVTADLRDAAVSEACARLKAMEADLDQARREVASMRKLLGEAQFRAEGDLLAVGHDRDGDARNKAMADLRDWIERIAVALSPSALPEGKI